MRNGFRLFLMGALGVAACAAAARAADDPPPGDPVTFDSMDGVKLKGTFFKSNPQNGAKDKNSSVLLLHNIDPKTGGNSHQDEWDKLAKALSEDGYSVLSFDFRGFGDSHEVSAATFWDPIKSRHNHEGMPELASKGTVDTIDNKDFKSHASTYYPCLVYDINAAKAWLDRRSNGGQANSSNLFLIGAGQGAALGALWMESQWHLKKVGQFDIRTGKYTFDEPEGRDIAGAVWLDISPKLGATEIPSTVKEWDMDLAGTNKVPMAFIVGKDNKDSASVAEAHVKAIEAKVRAENPSWNQKQIAQRLQYTSVHPIADSKLGGSELVTLDETKDFIKKYLDVVVHDVGVHDPRSHDINKMDEFLWTRPGSGVPITALQLRAKLQNEDSIHLIPVDVFMHP